MTKHFLAFLSILLLYFNPSFSQSLDSAIFRLSNQGTIEYKSIGLDGRGSKLYEDYQLLSSEASTEQLLQYSRDTSSSIGIYASWSLIDRGYDITADFLNFWIEIEKEYWIHSGCEHWKSSGFQLVYDQLRNPGNEIEIKAVRFNLDSTLLYSDTANKVLLEDLITKALSDHLFPQKFNQRIKELAFNDSLIGAQLYLSNWYKAEFGFKLKELLLEEYEKNPSDTKILHALLQLNDTETNSQVIDILENSLSEEFLFISPQEIKMILSEYGLFLR